MKIIVKTLKGEKFSIDVEASATVETIKQIIVRFRGTICLLFVLCITGYSASISSGMVLLHAHA